MRRAIVPVAVTLAAVLGSCDEPFGPLDRSYRLVSIASEPLPAIFTSNPSVTVRLVESRLQFRSATRGEERQRTSITSASDPTGVETESNANFSYRLAGDRLEITYDCADQASCIAGPHLAGRLVGEVLIFDRSLGRTPLVYSPD